MGKVSVLMINLQTDGSGYNLTENIALLQNCTSDKQCVLFYVTGQ